MVFAYSPVPQQRELRYHWHVTISIWDIRTNQSVPIPWGIGSAPNLWLNHTLDDFGPAGKAPLTTQDGSGVVHIESTRYRWYTLKDFFNIWGQTLTEDCVRDYCSDIEAGLGPPFLSVGPAGTKTEPCLDPGYLLRDTWEIIIFIGAMGGVPCF